MTFTASDVLLKAASRIEEEGMWCQGWFWGDTPENISFTSAWRHCHGASDRPPLSGVLGGFRCGCECNFPNPGPLPDPQSPGWERRAGQKAGTPLPPSVRARHNP